LNKENEEEKKEEDGPSLSTLFAVTTVVIILVVGFMVYNIVTGPFRMADELREHINDVNCSDDYRQGWLDCVDYWLDLVTSPQNATSK